MKFRLHPKYFAIALYVLAVYVICLILLILAFRMDIVTSALTRLLEIIAPVIWGIVIAWLLSPLVNKIEHYLHRLLNQSGRHGRQVRHISVFLSVFLLLLVIGGIAAAMIPELIRNMEALSEMLQEPAFFTDMEWQIHSFFTRISEFLSSDDGSMHTDLDNTESVLLHLFNRLVSSMTKLAATDGFLAKVTETLMQTFGLLKNLFLGIILASYLLGGKERFLAQGKKLICAFYPVEGIDAFFAFLQSVNRKFMGYFTGIALDCGLIGLISFIFMSLSKMPYALLISVLLALTNAIPVFGPFIGAIPSALLIFLVSPGKSMLFVIFTVILQQIDGNLIAPKIIGDQIGLSGFWIVSAVIIGGGFFGFVGMLLAVPLFAVLYSLVSAYTSIRLEKRTLPTDTASYMKASDKEKPPDNADGD
ncbi:MAG: AI-2E family transporter [Oscillospiraceae bacterium]|nr:AI-2E family transporter [Oscillospiraceae bacterium]